MRQNLITTFSSEMNFFYRFKYFSMTLHNVSKPHINRIIISLLKDTFCQDQTHHNEKGYC